MPRRSCACDIVTTHIVLVPAAAHAPDQPAKIWPAAGAAPRVTAALAANEALHVEPQLMPAGVLVTDPVPFTVTVRP